MSELTFRRVHRGSPALLFACMTEPAHLTHFWGPAGTTTPVENIVVDLRPGGAFETTMVNDTDGREYTMRAVYAEVSPPDRLVWTEAGAEGGMRTTVTFTDLGDGRTEVVTHQSNVPAAYRSAEAQAGFVTSLDRCAAYVAHLTSQESAMPTVRSADGTTIAYDRAGTGPAIILVDGALCHRGGGPMRPLAARLTGSFTVFTYDRRGRGESGDTLPYAAEREVEDLRAVLGAAGGRAALYAMSSGGALALATAAADPGVTGLVLYEPPFLGGNKEYTARLHEALRDGRRGDAVALFMTTVGVPAPVIAGMRSGPGWASLEAIAPTLAYDDTLLADGRVPAHRPITVPLLVVSGTASPEPLQQAARDTAAAFPAARHRALPGQTHDVQPEALAPVLIDFLGAG